MIRTEHHTISRTASPYVLAEIGLNHNGDPALAVVMARAAREAGAQAAKFQLFDVEHFIDPRARLGDGAPGSLADFFRGFQLTPEQWVHVSREVRDLGLDFVCSIFDRPSLEFYVEKLDGRLIKIASGDVTNRILIEDAAATGLPLVLSTGTADAAEVERAQAWAGNSPLGVLQCVSAYPAAPEDYDLNVIASWASGGSAIPGLSDHTAGPELAFAAVALGARIIEKHFTTDQTLPGPDQALSCNPADLRGLVDGVGRVHSALGSGVKECRAVEEPVRAGGRRSLHAGRAVEQGAVLQRDDLLPLRPGGGVGAELYPERVGRRTDRSYAPFEALES